MCSTTLHLLLAGLQEIEHRSIIGESRIYWYCLYQHGNGACQLFVCTTAIYRIEQRLLFIIVFRQQIAIYAVKESALENAVRLAEGINSFKTDTHLPLKSTYLRLIPFQVGY